MSTPNLNARAAHGLSCYPVGMPVFRRQLTRDGRATYSPTAMSPLDGFGQALRALRARAGLRQEDVDDKAEVSRGNMSDYEREVKRPKLATLEKILKALGADLYDLGVEARRAAGGALTARNGGAAAEDDPRIALIDRYAREIGLDAMAEVARRERGALVEAAVRRLDPSSGGAAE